MQGSPRSAFPSYRNDAPAQHPASAEYSAPRWDVEVDVAVIGAGLGGLATAIATVDAGGEVLVADAAPALRDGPAPVALARRVETEQSWLVHDTQDLDTVEYLAAVAEGIPASAPNVGDDAVPRRNARNLSRDEAYGRVETFVGSRLNAWAARCIVSPYGLMYSSTRDWPTVTMKSDDNQSIEVVSVGTVEWSDDLGANALRHWMTAEARKREIEVEVATLERIVFEEGVIVGVVLATSEGPYAVRTRAGVTIAPADVDEGADQPGGPTPGDRLHVCLVGRTASRFGRVELMATEPAAPSRPVCTGSRGQMRDGLHEARQPALEGWRCGKVHGHAAFGQ